MVSGHGQAETNRGVPLDCFKARPVDQSPIGGVSEILFSRIRLPRYLPAVNSLPHFPSITARWRNRWCRENAILRKHGEKHLSHYSVLCIHDIPVIRCARPAPKTDFYLGSIKSRRIIFVVKSKRVIGFFPILICPTELDIPIILLWRWSAVLKHFGNGVFYCCIVCGKIPNIIQGSYQRVSHNHDLMVLWRSVKECAMEEYTKYPQRPPGRVLRRSIGNFSFSRPSSPL